MTTQEYQRQYNFRKTMMGIENHKQPGPVCPVLGDVIMYNFSKHRVNDEFYKIVKLTAKTVTVEKLKAERKNLIGDFYGIYRNKATDELTGERRILKKSEITSDVYGTSYLFEIYP